MEKGVVCVYGTGVEHVGIVDRFVTDSDDVHVGSNGIFVDKEVAVGVVQDIEVLVDKGVVGSNRVFVDKAVAIGVVLDIEALQFVDKGVAGSNGARLLLDKNCLLFNNICPSFFLRTDVCGLNCGQQVKV